MSKVRMTEQRRRIVVSYMIDRHSERLGELPSVALRAEVSRTTCIILRKKWPEADMAVLRKYNLTHFDHCVRFSQESSGRVFAVRLSEFELVDIPLRGGCRGGDVLLASDEFAAMVDAWEKTGQAEQDAHNEVLQRYDAFVRACRYVDDVEAVISLPPEIRANLGSSSSLIAVNDGVVAQLREEFV